MPQRSDKINVGLARIWLRKWAITHKPDRQVDIDVGTVWIRKARLHRTPQRPKSKHALKQDLPLVWTWVAGWNAFSLMLGGITRRSYPREDWSQQGEIHWLEYWLSGRPWGVSLERYRSEERPDWRGQRIFHPEAKSGSLFTLNQAIMVSEKPMTHSSWRGVDWLWAR